MAESEEKRPVERFIKSLEEAYFDLRRRYPGRDEHWYLASTWRQKYGSGEEAREKGAEWAKFTAYRDTHEFAFLEPPASIRGLALHLAYTELGEQATKPYEDEFFQIIKPVTKSKEDRTFLDGYQERNPLTWKEIQEEGSSTYSLYWFFKGLELEQEREGAPVDEWGEVDIIEELEKEEEEEAGEETTELG